MASKTVNLGDFGAELKKFSNLHLKKQQEAIVSGLLKSLRDLVAASPMDTGAYAASWDFTVDEKKAVVGNYAPHAAIIELGARPFTPPIAPLLAWAKRVLKSDSQPPNYDSHVWGLARYTQAKIAREGMKPRHVLEKTIPVIIENIKAELRRIA